MKRLRSYERAIFSSITNGLRSMQSPAAEVERYAKTYGLKRVVVYAQKKVRGDFPPYLIRVEFNTGLAAREYSSRDGSLREFCKKLSKLANTHGAPIVRGKGY